MSDDTTEAAPPPKRAWARDIIAGASVGLVLVPQSMAYSELAGLPPHHGLYAAALPPLVAAFFASSPYLQTGPTALTSLLSFGALASLATPGSAEYVGLAALLALVVGAVRVVVDRLKAGTIAYLMSMPVLRGFTSGAAVLILSSQLPSVFGLVAEGDSVLARALFAVMHPGAWETVALALTGGTIVLIIGGRKAHALFPGVLVAVIVGIIYSVHAGYDGRVVGEVPAVLFPPLTIDLPWTKLPSLLVSGGVIALVGFAEAASISQTYAELDRSTWDPNAEFVSQGAANIAAGLFGGLPVGGSIVRSALNRQAGAVTRASGAVTGIIALGFLPFAYVISPLPMAILGAIVVAAVLKLLDPRPLMELYRKSALQGAVAVLTFLLTLLLAPHVEYAVIGGIALALAVHAWRETAVEVDSERVGETLYLRPRGVIWFASATSFRQRMAAIIANSPEASSLVIELSRLGRVDLSGAFMLRDLAESAALAGLEVSFSGGPKRAAVLLARVCGDIRHEKQTIPPKPGE